jgi:hypothetical protein
VTAYVKRATKITTRTGGITMADRPEKTSRKTIALSGRLWDAIDEFRHAERIRTEIEAIRRLLEMGLEAAGRNSSQAKPVFAVNRQM